MDLTMICKTKKSVRPRRRRCAETTEASSEDDRRGRLGCSAVAWNDDRDLPGPAWWWERTSEDDRDVPARL